MSDVSLQEEAGRGNERQHDDVSQNRNEGEGVDFSMRDVSNREGRRKKCDDVSIISRINRRVCPLEGHQQYQ